MTLLAVQIKELLEEGQPDDHLRLALQLMADKGAGPSTLPLLLVEAVRRRRRAPMSAFIDEYGWPTGCRLKRGSHSVTHDYDVLGTERPPAGWPYDRPERADVEAMLLALDSLGRFLHSDVSVVRTQV